MSPNGAVWVAAIGTAGCLASAAAALWKTQSLEKHGGDRNDGSSSHATVVPVHSEATDRVAPPQASGPDTRPRPGDVFIAFSGQESSEVASDLARVLRAKNLTVLLDQDQLRLGESMWVSIEDRLARSRHGVLILSPGFFDDRSRLDDLMTLTGRKAQGRQAIVPVYAISKLAPPLPDRVALNLAEESVSAMGDKIAAVTKLETVESG